jgi:hypothetical protein
MFEQQRVCKSSKLPKKFASTKTSLNGKHGLERVLTYQLLHSLHLCPNAANKNGTIQELNYISK